ncbi:MAG: hypothetical protein JSW52_00715 [Candidatus Coatesbacteria bacterium]|nr:MAG: hypothetical protein JSW52_00715 [Candidatus Coatesbacteria bacterium]
MSPKTVVFVVFAITVILFGLSCSDPTGPSETPNATDPSPVDGATGVDFSEKLSWEITVNGTYTYDIYFGTESPPPVVGTGLTEKTYDPGGLAYEQRTMGGLTSTAKA